MSAARNSWQSHEPLIDQPAYTGTVYATIIYSHDDLSIEF